MLLLTGCGSTHVIVRDQGTGAAVINARAMQLDGGTERELDTASADGRMSFSLPATPESVIAVRAAGFVQWSKTVAWLRTQPQPLTIDLEPVWMGTFLKTGKRPSEIVTPSGCNCAGKKAQ